MKAKKILLTILSVLVLGSLIFAITFFGDFGPNTSDSSSGDIISSESISDSEDLTPSDSSSEELPHVHVWNDGEVTKEVTCTTDGEITYTCTSCDEFKFETITALGHTEVVDAAVEPTCTETGLTEGKHCSECNEILVEQEEVAAIRHNYAEIVTNPTCEEQGYTTHTCITCGDVYVDSYIDALEHTYNVELEKVAATCNQDGHIKYACVYCDSTKIEVLNKLDHVFSFIVDSLEPTCEEEGFECGYCDNCGEYIENTIEATGHIAGEITYTDGFCGEHKIGYSSCVDCGTLLYEVGHKYEKQTTHPTCETEGKIAYTCINCNDTYYETTKALGHVAYEWTILKEATCNEEGLMCQYCETCNECIHYEEISKLNHTYSSAELENGILYTCDECNDSYFVETVEIYTITLMSNSTIEYKPLKVASDEAITLPIPTKEGYEFGGWYYDEELENPCDETAEFAKDTTLYAGWYASYIEGSIYANNIITDAPLSYTFDVTTNVVLNNDNLSSYITIKDNLEKTPSIYISNKDGNVYTIASNEYMNGMSYSVSITDQLAFNHTNESQIWFVVEDETYSNITFKSDVVFISDKEIYNLYEDTKGDIYLSLKSDMLNAGDNAVVYSENIYDIASLINVIAESKVETLYTYIITEANPENIFEEYSFYSSGSVDVSNIELDKNIEESIIDEFENSALFSQFSYAATTFSRSTKNGKISYEFDGTEINCNISRNEKEVTILLEITAKFKKVNNINTKEKFNIKLQIVSKLSFDITLSAQSSNNFTFITESSTVTRIDLVASINANQELTEFKDKLFRARKEGKYNTLDPYSASLVKKQKIGAIPFTIFGIKFSLDFFNVMSFDAIGELGISVELDTNSIVGIRQISNKYETLKSFEAHVGLSFYLLGKIELSDMIEVELSANFWGLAKVSVSLAVGPYVETGGMFTFSVSSQGDKYYSTNGYMSMGIKVKSNITLKNEITIPIIKKTITLFNYEWSLYSNEYPIFTFGDSKVVLYYSDYDEYIDLNYDCNSLLDLNDYVNKEALVQDFEEMSKETKNIDGKYTLIGDYEGVNLTEDGKLSVSSYQLDNLSIKIKMYNEDIYKFINLNLIVNHNYELTNENLPTCTTDGLSTYTCTCGKIYSEIIPPLGHNYNSVVKKPTCEKQGYTTHTCENCNDTYVDTYTEALNHDYQVSDHEDATCTEDGYTTYVCSHDEAHTYTDVHTAIGHNYTSVVTNPTCEEQGYTTHTCENCNDTYVDTYTEALNHDYQVSDHEDATCTEDGYTTYVCSHDEAHTYTDVHEATGHSYVDYVCDECGYHYYTEGLEYKLSANGHCYSVVGIGIAIDTDIVIPSTYSGLPVISIDEKAFKDCSSLTSVTISDGVTNIGDYAFYKCSSLTSITIPESLTSIGIIAFSGCSSLTKVYYTGTIEDWCNISFDNSSSNPLSNGADLYIDNQKVTNIEIPDGVTSIGDYAFSYCSSLTSIVIPDSVTYIGYQIFSGCGSLTSIIVDNNNKYYDSRNDCNAIIETSTNTLIAVCKNTTIPDSVTSIGWYAFLGCSSLISVTIPESVTSIGDHAFYGCSSLTKVYYNGTIEDWCNITFDNSSSNPLSNGADLYIDNQKVTNIEIPDGVTSIGDYAFSYCSSLTSVTIPDSVTSIGNYAFYECSSLTSITIPESVTSIGDFAFRGCSSLTSITIPESVTNIGNSAFYKCTSLTSIEIPESVTSIGYSAFEGCSSLTSVTLPDRVTYIGYGAFYNCTSLTSITIPESVTSIGDGAFYGCSSLISVTIPDSVTSFGRWAFYGCSSLTDVYYTGTKEQWNNTKIEISNEPLTNATIHFAENVIWEGTTQGFFEFDEETGLYEATIELDMWNSIIFVYTNAAGVEIVLNYETASLEGFTSSDYNGVDWESNYLFHEVIDGVDTASYGEFYSWLGGTYYATFNPETMILTVTEML